MEIDGINYFTQEDVDKLLQTEGDRRVTSALNKWREDLPTIISGEKEKWINESKMSAEEIAQKEVAERMKELEERENQIKFQGNMLGAKEKLTTAGIPQTEYEKMLGILVTHDDTKTVENIDNFISVYTSTKTNLENDIRTQFSKIPKPQTGGQSEMTKSEFMKLPYADKIKLKQDNPELYSTFLK